MTISSDDTHLRVVNRPGEWQPRLLDVFAGLFVATLLISNLVAVKIFSIGPLVFTCGILVFPISYILGDVLTECYGFSRTRRIIWLGLIANLFMVLILKVSIVLPPAEGWELQEEFKLVHAIVPRIVAASLIAYCLGEFTNSIVMSNMKVRQAGKRFGLRAVLSTVCGQAVDTAVFVTIGFWGSLPNKILLAAIVSGWLFKCVYEIVALPITYWIVGNVKRIEGVEHFDSHETYNPLRV